LDLLFRIVRKHWPALLVVLLMGGVSTLVGYELYGRWHYAEQLRRVPDCGSWTTFPLRDGRRLSYRETGSRTGQPAFYFHGGSGSAEEWPIVHEHRLRLIALDRPGYGCSTPQPGRSYNDWADDVRQVADQLGWNRFDVIGFAAGAPYALAVAAYAPDRVRSVQAIGTIFSAPVSRMRLLAPGISYQLLATMRESAFTNAEAFESQSTRGLSALDQQVYAANGPLLRAARDRALRNSVSGIYEDLRLLGNDLPFDLSRLNVPVHVWHGAEDRVAPFEKAEPLFRSIPRVEITRVEGEGHFLIYGREREILGN
jgi:pimeloyl-ACP methyl ester carboxylesterase